MDGSMDGWKGRQCLVVFKCMTKPMCSIDVFIPGKGWLVKWQGWGPDGSFERGR